MPPPFPSNPEEGENKSEGVPPLRGEGVWEKDGKPGVLVGRPPVKVGLLVCSNPREGDMEGEGDVLPPPPMPELNEGGVLLDALGQPDNELSTEDEIEGVAVPPPPPAKPEGIEGVGREVGVEKGIGIEKVGREEEVGRLGEGVKTPLPVPAYKGPTRVKEGPTEGVRTDVREGKRGVEVDCLPTPPAPPGVREGVKVRGALAELKGLGESLG